MRILAPLAFTAMLAVTLAGLPAYATQEYHLPTLFDVAHVAADDVLNIRQQPDAGSPVIATLAANAKGIEVVEERRGWGRINSGEASGWVSMRYLSYRTDVWQPGELPDNFRCLGNEPFWNVRTDGDQLIYTTPEKTESQPLAAVLDSGVFRDPTRAVVGQTLTLTAVPQQCSDGMSDRVYGLRAILVRGGDQPAMLTGCCLIQK